MKLTNKTKMANEDIRMIIQLVKPASINKFRVEVTYTSMTYFKGAFYPHYFSDGDIGLVKLYIPKRYNNYPYMRSEYYDQQTLVLSPLEEFVWMVAHELMHVKQFQSNGKYRKTYNSKGQFSEKDTTAYSRKMLRKFRRLSNVEDYIAFCLCHNY